jgi:hypothetical protein
MKKILSTLLLTAALPLFSQVIIGDAIGTATTKTSVLLEFAENEGKGIIVPYVRTLPVAPEEGTILLDASDEEKAKVVYYNGEWQDLSNIADVSLSLADQPAGVSEAAQGVFIGSTGSVMPPTNNVKGCVVLESTTKAMVLPIVENIADIKNPAPGMIAFLSNPKRLAVFNGEEWSFWSK